MEIVLKAKAPLNKEGILGLVGEITTLGKLINSGFGSKIASLRDGRVLSESFMIFLLIKFYLKLKVLPFRKICDLKYHHRHSC